MDLLLKKELKVNLCLFLSLLNNLFKAIIYCDILELLRTLKGNL